MVVEGGLQGSPLIFANASDCFIYAANHNYVCLAAFQLLPSRPTRKTIANQVPLLKLERHFGKSDAFLEIRLLRLYFFRFKAVRQFSITCGRARCSFWLKDQ